jgi:hypothetical protein
MKCNKTLSKWCKNKHGASKIRDTFETYHISCSPSAKLDINGFRAKIIHYMAAGRDNSIAPGCGTPSRAPTHEN